ncbi:hypothetical protein GGR51DRAFT_576859 [Nemania sp. FL0031]|nr:hypothetical protein GGR51DRAFT_576859 [Nemania sp. FL0031]
MIKGGAAHDGESSHRRRPSISGFLKKVLPSHRAEQGGTVRVTDITGDSDSAYIDLGMNPNDLTEWNLAQDKQFEPQPPEASARTRHHRDRSRTLQRGLSQLRHGRSRSSQVPRATVGLDRDRSPHPKLTSKEWDEKPRPITREEVSAMLQDKEESRQQRRDLKESGDWLGVQGADPYSGEFAVLTPTSTLSSESTPTSTRNRLAELSQMQRNAKLAYEEAKLEEITAREIIRLKKGQSKLKKMEHAKDELRKKQQGFPTWSQHRRRWSSNAAGGGPELSPIPQSVKSYKPEDSSDEVAAVPVRNFSRPSIHSGGSPVNQPKPTELAGNSENTEPSNRDQRKTQSTDTVVHKTLPNIEVSNTPKASTRILYPSVFSDTDDAPIEEQKNEKPFLRRRRRRMTDPGKLVKRLGPIMAHSSAGKTEENLVSNSLEPPPLIAYPQSSREPRDHFSDLLIPDPRLHLVLYQEQGVAMESPLAPMKRDSSLTTSRPVESSHSEARGKPALGIATNLSDFQGSRTKPRLVALDTKEATATSSQSKLRGNTKPTAVYQKEIPRRSSSFQARLTLTPEPQIQAQNAGQGLHHIKTSPSQDIEGQSDIQKQSTRHVGSKTQIMGNYIEMSMSKYQGEDVKESASIPTITITGFDPNPQLPLEGIQSHTGTRNDGKGATMSADGILPTPKRQSSDQALYREPTTVREWNATSSHPTTPRSDSQSSVVAREIRGPDTTSMNPTILGADPTPTAQQAQPNNPPSMLKDARKRFSWELPEAIGVALSPPQHHNTNTNQEQNAQLHEHKLRRVSLQRHRRNSRVREPPHRRIEPSEDKDKDSMIQEAARIAMRRSRAREVVTRSHSPSRTPSPRTKDTKEAAPAIPDTPNLRGNGSGNGDTDLPFIRIGSIDTPPPSPPPSLPQGLQHRNSGEVKRQGSHKNRLGEEGTESSVGQETSTADIVDLANRKNARASGAAMTFVLSFLVTACMVWFGLACAWWVMVRPAFDQRSHLWKRRRKRETTWEDVGVFAAAGVFFVVTALVVAGGVRTGVRVVGMV